MDAFADKLGRVGAWCGQNKYLGAIKNAFQNFMPATIAGAIGVLWTNVSMTYLLQFLFVQSHVFQLVS